jgi:hypothetical protein
MLPSGSPDQSEFEIVLGPEMYIPLREQQLYELQVVHGLFLEKP